MKLLAGRISLTGSREGQSDRAGLLLGVVEELQRQAIWVKQIHTHTLPISSHRLRKVLDDNPGWEDVLTLWNRGKSQGEIAKELSISVSKVKSAVQQLEYWGFDVVRGKPRERQKETDGNFSFRILLRLNCPDNFPACDSLRRMATGAAVYILRA